MKLVQIVRAFDSVKGTQEPIVERVFDSVSEFSRKIELLPAFKEIQSIYELYLKEQQEIIRTLIGKYCKENGLDPASFTQVPPGYMGVYMDRVGKLLDSEVEILHKIKFLPEELERSGVTVSQLAKLEGFIS